MMVLFGFRNLLLCILVFSMLNAGRQDAAAQGADWEWQWLHRLEQKRSDGGIRFYKNTATFSNIASVGVPLTATLIAIGSHRKADREQALYLGGNFLLTAGYTYALKWMIDKERPATADPLFTAIGSGSSASFPSGHTSRIFGTVTAMTLLYPKWYVIVPGYTLATLTAYGRLYQGQHYPTDVLAGALLGSGAALLHYKLRQWLFQKKAAKKD